MAKLRQGEGAVIRLGRGDLDSEQAAAQTDPDVVYEFNTRDLTARDDSPSRQELGPNDLEPRRPTDQDRKQRKREKRRCLCIFLVIVGKTQAYDGRWGSKYAQGKWRSQRDLMNLLENMADYLLDCIDEICVHLVEKDMSGAEWPPFFARDLDGRLLEYIDQKQKQAVIDKLRSQYPKWSKDCLWLLLNRIVDVGLAGQRPGTTPADTPQVPGTKTHTVKSDNYSFISDKAEGFQIAHELLHQAGVTHSKDNLLPEDDDGKVDMNGHTPGNARPKTDLMHPVSRGGAKLQAADCAKFRDYTKGHKCCDEV